MINDRNDLCSLFTVTIPYPLVDTDCYKDTTSGQLYVANPDCYDNCTLVYYCASPLNEITCVTPPYTCELEIIVRVIFIVMFETTACVYVECSVMIGI